MGHGAVFNSEIDIVGECFPELVLPLQKLVSGDSPFDLVEIPYA
jgi:hypothetical protein